MKNFPQGIKPFPQGMKPFPYEDIVHLAHPEPKRHKRMPMSARAAQFAPFAALSGHEEAIMETARETVMRPALSEDDLERLNRCHQILAEHLEERPLVRFTVFIPDKCKEGGSIETVQGAVASINEEKRSLQLTDRTVLSMDNVIAMEGPLFQDLF